MKKHSVRIKGHETSISLEDPFWGHLKVISAHRDMSLNALISEIDAKRSGENLSSALRLYVLHWLEAKLAIETSN